MNKPPPSKMQVIPIIISLNMAVHPKNNIISATSREYLHSLYRPAIFQHQTRWQHQPHRQPQHPPGHQHRHQQQHRPEPQPSHQQPSQPCRRRRATLCGYSRQSISSAITLILGTVPRLPLSLLRATPSPLLMPLRIHPPRQPHRNQTQHRHHQHRQYENSKKRSYRIVFVNPNRISQPQ